MERLRRLLTVSVTAWALLALACGAATGGDETGTTVTAPPEDGLATPTLAPVTAAPAGQGSPSPGLATPGDGLATPTLAPSATPGGPGGGSGQATATPAGGAGNGNGNSGNGSTGNGNGNTGNGGGSSGACVGGGQNLLQNPSFEGSYQPFLGINEINTAASWIPWWEDDGQTIFRPEFKPADGNLFANRVVSGQLAQQYFKSFGRFTAGLYQSVLNISPGARLQAAVFAQAWSCQDNCGGALSGDPAQPRMRIGLDPLGGDNPRGREVVWSDFANPLDRWERLCVRAVAQSDIVTVFLWASPDAPRQTQDVYWDDASLMVVP